MKKASEILEIIDEIISTINKYRVDPGFKDEIRRRKSRNPDHVKSDSEVLRLIASLIAYSQNAKSGSVGRMLGSGTFDMIFHHFNVGMVANADENKIINKYWKTKKDCINNETWNQLTVIRQQRKIYSIIQCAKAMQDIQNKYGSFHGFLSQYKLPKDLKSINDMENFWSTFNDIKNKLQNVRMPFISKTTTLLHLLMDLGYPCMKPDLVVMKVSEELGLVDSNKGERNLIKAIKAVQIYHIQTQMKPSIVDLYFLIWGGQDGVKGLVKPLFYQI